MAMPISKLGLDVGDITIKQLEKLRTKIFDVMALPTWATQPKPTTSVSFTFTSNNTNYDSTPSYIYSDNSIPIPPYTYAVASTEVRSMAEVSPENQIHLAQQKPRVYLALLQTMVYRISRSNLHPSISPSFYQHPISLRGLRIAGLGLPNAESKRRLARCVITLRRMQYSGTKCLTHDT